eukprot:1509940-Pyramimonas_sp.AAC.1
MKSHSKIGIFETAASLLQARPLPWGRTSLPPGGTAKDHGKRLAGPHGPLQLRGRQALEHLGDAAPLLVAVHAGFGQPPSSPLSLLHAPGLARQLVGDAAVPELVEVVHAELAVAEPVRRRREGLRHLRLRHVQQLVRVQVVEALPHGVEVGELGVVQQHGLVEEPRLAGLPALGRVEQEAPARHPTPGPAHRGNEVPAPHRPQIDRAE